MTSAAVSRPQPAARPWGAVRRVLRQAGLWASIVVVVSPAILVFLWMLSLSLKTELENTAYPPVFIPRAPTLANFIEVFEKSPFAQYTLNSIIVSGVSTLAALVVGVPAGYGIAKARASGLAMVLMISRMTPGLSYLIPLFILFRIVGLMGTLWSLVITHLVITVPIVIWVMMGFFESQHSELEEAALIDGCDIWRAFLHVAMPLSRSGIVVAGILAFIYSWNNFIFGVVLAGRDPRL